MNLDELQSHAAQVEVVPMFSREALIKKLTAEFEVKKTKYSHLLND